MPKAKLTDDGRVILPNRRGSLRDKINAQAIALTFDGKPAGSILLHFSRGMTVRAEVQVHDGPLEIRAAVILDPRHFPDAKPMTVNWATGSAGGGGYCKASGAIDDALSTVRAGNPAIAALPDLHGRGMGAVRSAFEGHGYGWHQIV